jgi:hypothetical protein
VGAPIRTVRRHLFAARARRLPQRPAIVVAAIVALGWLGGFSRAAATAPQGGAHSSPLKAMWGPAIHDGVSLFPTYRDLGVRIYEDDLHWDTTAPRRPSNPLDPNDPAYVWPAEVTRAVSEATRYHIQVALEIVGAPEWANGGKPWNWAPENPQDYADFAIAAARRYPSVHLWMIWGEPTRAHNFEPLTPAPRFARLNAAQQRAPHLYARILDAAYGALKSVSPSNVVIGGMTFTTGDISTQQWIENMRLPDGRPPRLDMYGHNPFSFREPNLSNPPAAEQWIDFSDLPILARLVDHYLGRPGNRHPKLFISEWTIPTGIDDEFDFYVDPSVQAKWITAGLRIASDWPRIYAVGWINLYDNPPETFGGLLRSNGTKKPGYFAWKAG